jgi:hypothetical protein
MPAITAGLIFVGLRAAADLYDGNPLWIGARDQGNLEETMRG